MLKFVRILVLACVAPVLLTAEVALAAQPAPVESVATPVQMDVGADYAQREIEDANLAKFEGGGAGIYIGGSTAALVLVIVLLVVLL